MALGIYLSFSCLCIFFGLLTADRMGLFKRKNHFPVDSRTVLITGGSQGMGRSVARKLSEKGANVIVVARNVAKLEDAIASISAAALSPSSQRFHYISGDLTSPTECSRIIAEATAWNGGAAPDILWCCAGMAHPTLFLDTPVEKLKEQMDSNYFSSAYMAHAILKSWLKVSALKSPYAQLNPSRPRHLIFTSSVVAFLPLIGYNSYSPPKTALRALSDGLSQEMQLYASSGIPPVSLHTIFPGSIFSPGYEEEEKIKPDITKLLEEDDKGQTTDQVAVKSIAALERGEELIVTEILGRALICGSLGTSKRNGFPLVDTLLSWAVSIVLPFVRREMDGKVQKWGKAHGTSGKKRR